MIKKFSEKHIQKRVLRFLDGCHIYYVKTMVSSRAGVPDCIACINGKFVGIEFKGDGGKESQLQKLAGRKIVASYGQYFVISPKNIKAFLNRITFNIKDF